jgi:hypothetical protein
LITETPICVLAAGVPRVGVLVVGVPAVGVLVFGVARCLWACQSVWLAVDMLAAGTVCLFLLTPLA